MLRPNVYTEEHADEMSSKNWITESLERKISENFPTDDDVIMNHATTKFTYKNESFKRAYEAMLCVIDSL